MAATTMNPAIRARLNNMYRDAAVHPRRVPRNKTLIPGVYNAEECTVVHDEEWLKDYEGVINFNYYVHAESGCYNSVHMDVMQIVLGCVVMVLLVALYVYAPPFAAFVNTATSWLASKLAPAAAAAATAAASST